MKRASGHIEPVTRERRHTLYFLEEIRAFAPVFLDTEVDMTAVRAHRQAARVAGQRYSTVSYVLFTAARVLARHPRANAAILGRRRPRITEFPAVHGKLTMDKVLAGRRVVLATVLPDLDRASLAQIQQRVAHHRDGDPDQMPEFAGLRALHRLPYLLGRTAFRRAVRPLPRRATAMGTFAVTSLGHRPVDGFHSVGGTTVTLGLGQIADRPVVRGAALAIAPVMRLNLAFDHRVIDGAEAADVLTEIRTGLESFQDGPEPAGGTPPGANADASTSAGTAQPGGRSGRTDSIGRSGLIGSAER